MKKMDNLSLLTLLQNSKGMTRIVETKSPVKEPVEQSNDLLKPYVSSSMQAPDVPPIVEKEFGPNYGCNMSKIHRDYISNAKSGRLVQDPNDPSIQFEQRYLKQKSYLVLPAKADRYDRDGKKVQVPGMVPQYPRRITFFNGGNAHFPFSEWDSLFGKRAVDIVARTYLFDNDVAYANEGLCAFFELDYKNKNQPVPSSEIIEHALHCQDIMREYYHSNPTIDYRMWVLTCIPKPKKVSGEDKPMIANGAHVVFPYIVVDDEIGNQLNTTASQRLRKKFGRVDVVDNCYKQKTKGTTLRPIYSMKLETCLECEDIADLRYRCVVCMMTGKIGSGSVYRPSFLFDTHGNSMEDEKKDLINNHLEVVCRETSIVPATDNGDFTPGYLKPESEPLFIPLSLRSTHKSDVGKNCVYKADRVAMNKRKAALEEIVVDPCVLSMITSEIKLYHKVYEKLTLGEVTKKNNVYFVNMAGEGRSFCRIHEEYGKNHQTNRIYFMIDYKTKSIIQMCYDDACRKLYKSNKSNIVKLLRQKIDKTTSHCLFKEMHEVTTVTLPPSKKRLTSSYMAYLAK
jgi:hypothetical protein